MVLVHFVGVLPDAAPVGQEAAIVDESVQWSALVEGVTSVSCQVISAGAYDQMVIPGVQPAGAMTMAS